MWSVLGCLNPQGFRGLIQCPRPCCRVSQCWSLTGVYSSAPRWVPSPGRPEGPDCLGVPGSVPALESPEVVPDPALQLCTSHKGALCFLGVRPCLGNPRLQCPKQVRPFLVPVPGLAVPRSPGVS